MNVVLCPVVWTKKEKKERRMNGHYDRMNVIIAERRGAVRELLSLR